jgi:hypothetical protein
MAFTSIWSMLAEVGSFWKSVRPFIPFVGAFTTGRSSLPHRKPMGGGLRNSRLMLYLMFWPKPNPMKNGKKQLSN